jgi:hypothetical protein
VFLMVAVLTEVRWNLNIRFAFPLWARMLRISSFFFFYVYLGFFL